MYVMSISYTHIHIFWSRNFNTHSFTDSLCCFFFSASFILLFLLTSGCFLTRTIHVVFGLTCVLSIRRHLRSTEECFQKTEGDCMHVKPTSYALSWLISHQHYDWSIIAAHWGSCPCNHVSTCSNCNIEYSFNNTSFMCVFMDFPQCSKTDMTVALWTDEIQCISALQ